MFARNQAQHAISEEFESLIVDSGAVLAMRPVSQGPFETFGQLEMVTEDRLKLVELPCGHGRVAFLHYFGCAACLRAASAFCLQRSCKPPMIWEQRLNASAASGQRFSFCRSRPRT